MPVIVRIPVVVIPVIVVPVVRPPGIPVGGIVTPVPGRTPGYIPGHVDEPDHRPGSHLIGGCMYHIPIPGSPDITRISGIRGFAVILIVIGFNDVVPSIQGFITDQLDVD